MARVARAGHTGGPKRGVQGASAAGKAPGSLWPLARSGTGSGAGAGSLPRAPGTVLWKRVPRCVCARPHSTVLRGGAAAGSSRAPHPQHPRHPRTASDHARSSREHPAGKQRVLQSEPGKSPALPAAARQPAAIPAAAAGFLRCCPRRGSKRGVVLGGTTGKPCEGQLLLAMGQQRGLGWHQMLCHEPGYGPAAAAHSARRGSAGEPRTDFRQGEGVMREGGMGSH